MKNLIAIAIAAMALAGCHTAHIEVGPDGTWSADIYDNFIRREFKGLKAEVAEGGKFKAEVNGYATDASEQLPAFTREMWAGLGILGRLAASTINPAVASVPLTAEAADATQVAALVKASAEAKAALASAKAELEKAKADLVAAQAAQTTEEDCADGSCEKK